MKFIKKSGKELFKVKNPNAFKNMEVVCSDLLNDRIFYFMQNCAANSLLENKYENWLTKHFRDYAFNIVVDKQGNYYAVAYADEVKASYAIEILEVDENEIL